MPWSAGALCSPTKSPRTCCAWPPRASWTSTGSRTRSALSCRDRRTRQSRGPTPGVVRRRGRGRGQRTVLRSRGGQGRPAEQSSGCCSSPKRMGCRNGGSAWGRRAHAHLELIEDPLERPHHQEVCVHIQSTMVIKDCSPDDIGLALVIRLPEKLLRHVRDKVPHYVPRVANRRDGRVSVSTNSQRGRAQALPGIRHRRSRQALQGAAPLSN